MDTKMIEKILADTSYVRTGGSAAELRAAEYLRDVCAKFAQNAHLEAFEVDMATVREATLTVDGCEIPCKGYLCAGSGEVEAPLYYLRESDRYSRSQCRGKIVLFDGFLGYRRYRELRENGAVGFISYDGNVNYTDRDIDQRELRSYVACGEKMPGVNINAKDAVELIRAGAGTARITLAQEETRANSHNVVLDLAGESEQLIVFSAHYDTTSLSTGAYDNMSGCIGLLALAEHFSHTPHRHSLRFVFCGSEERGLLGSKAYCAAHREELANAVLNINLDMIGSVMGKFIACATAEQALVQYVSYLGCELGFQVKASQDVYSSDSTPFADCGVPAISFARIAGPNLATIHNSYDTPRVLSAEQILLDIGFIRTFAERMANAVICPVAREIPGNMREKLDEYLCKKAAKSE